MDPRVIGADDFEREIRLQLSKRHGRRGLGIEVAALAHVREMRTWKEVDCAHHRADQPLDMAAEARRSRRPVGQIDRRVRRRPARKPTAWNSAPLST